MKNHRIVVTRRGGPDVLQMIEEDLPQPGPDEVRVKVVTAGVSAYDVMLRSGWFPGFPRVPFTPGVDIVGVVDQPGGSVTGLETGQLIACPLGLSNGGYAEYVTVPVGTAVPVPAGADPADAVCLVANYLTAELMLHGPGQVEPGQRILVHGGAGGVGTALLQLGALEGLEMYATASEHNHELVTSLGATPIDYRNEDFVERVRDLTGDGVDVVFDPIGGARQLWRSYRTLRKGGRLVWFGVAATKTSGMRVIPSSLVARLGLSLIPDGRAAPLAPTAEGESQAVSLASLLELLAAGKIQPVIAKRLPLSDAAEAHRILERGGSAGKVVLDVAPA